MDLSAILRVHNTSKKIRKVHKKHLTKTLENIPVFAAPHSETAMNITIG